MNKSLSLTGPHCLWLVMIILILDLSSKFFILRNFAPGEIISIFHFFNLCFVRNYGIAFGFFSNSGGLQRWVSVGITIGICVSLILMLLYSKVTHKLMSIAYSLIVGGALGNLFDRLWNGFVIDMIDFYIGKWHFATFNIADTAIFIGAALIVLEDFLLKKTT